MPKRITNNYQIDLPIALWLLQNGYNSGADEAPEGELISVTTLMKPTRSLILQRQVEIENEVLDISDLIKSRMGHALHDSIERSWTEMNIHHAMKRLHYPDHIIERILINPDPETITKNDIPIYLEQRRFKEVFGIVLTGQLDFCINGAYRDFKSTSTYAYTSGKKDKDYILQGSLYRYIMPELITKNTMRIEFIFTDWQKFRSKIDKNYPQIPTAHKEYSLMSIKDTENWVENKINHIRKNAKYAKKQDKLVRCTDEELWRSDDSYKYFSNPEKAVKGNRCQKSFNNMADAQLYLQEKGKGKILTVKGEVKACTYCPAFSVCEQRKEYFDDDGESIQ